MYPRLFENELPPNFKLKIDMDICKWWDSCNKLDFKNNFKWDYNEVIIQTKLNIQFIN